MLYSSPDGTDNIRYLLGMDHVVLIGSTTMKYNDIMAAVREVPILSRRVVATVPANKTEPKR